MKTYSRVYAKIDLDAIAYNMEQMKQNIRPETKVMAVIKADGYGHGAVQIAEMMERWNYIWGFAVATLDEAVVLRTEGIQKPILVLGCVFPDQYMEMLKHEIRMNIYTEEMAESISRMAAREGKTAYMHIKLDTGMSRLGFGINEQSAETIKRISKMPNVNMEGIFTHFTKADEKDKSFTKKQIQEFVWMTERLKEKNVRFTYEHCSNSAGIIEFRYCKSRNFYIWTLSIGRGRQDKRKIKTGIGIKESCGICKGDRERDSCELRRHVRGQRENEDCNNSGRICRWISKKLIK